MTDDQYLWNAYNLYFYLILKKPEFANIYNAPYFNLSAPMKEYITCSRYIVKDD